VSTADTLPSTISDLEELSRLDRPAKAVADRVRDWLQAGPVKDAVSGTWLGHPVHPLLTDLVVGSLTSASLVDVLARSAVRGQGRPSD
jgi:hypothetical protein